MKIEPTIAVQRYKTVRDELKAASPQMWSLVIQLCNKVPDSITSEHVWLYGRDKPCWSNIRVNIGERIAADILGSPYFKLARTIAQDSWEIKMRDLNARSRWKANDNFILVGVDVINFVNQLSRGGIASYIWKLYAIRNLAIALQQDPVVREMVDALSTRPIIPTTHLRKWTKTFADRVGMGWGVVTVYHLLTDLGLTPKPDLHLKKSAIRMGLLSPYIPSNYPMESFHEVSDHDIVLAVMELAERVDPTACPAKPNSALREVDKVLMEWSRQGLAYAM